jgi:hypothetical protein
MDMDALTVVMRELDTISDFVAYIRERADAIRDRRVSMAASEADLLAAYLLSDAPEGRPFIPNIVDLAHPFELGTASDKSCRSTCRLRTAENSQSLPDRDHICGCEWTAGLDLQIQRRERQQCRRLRKQQLVIPEGRLPTRSFRRLQTISRHSVAGA